MMRFLGLLLLVLGLQSCDDGDFSIESFDFSTTAAVACSGTNNQFFIYYTNQSEALLLQIPANSFPNLVTPQNQPRTVTIGGSNQLIYRAFNGTVTSQTICNSIPPATPIVTREWIATSGVIEIETFANKATNETTGQSLVTGYTHTLRLRNTTFEKNNGEQQLFAVLELGNYVTNTTPPSVIISSNPVNQCGNNVSFVYKNAGAQAITISTDALLFTNSNTPTNQPRTAVIGQNNTAISYRLYDAIIPIPTSFFCTTPNPSTPALLEQWNGVNGVADLNGIIEVATVEEFDQTLQSNVFKHTIRLRKVVFSKDNVTFTFGDLFELGVLTTVP